MITRVLRAGVIVFLVAAGSWAAVFAQDGNSVAQKSVESWISLVDEGRYSESWQAAGATFRNAVTADKWGEAARAARAPFGPVKSRSIKSATSAKTLPGAPDGDYVVFQFGTAFEKKAAAVETVTAVRETDGNWRVVGYFIR
jgi:hypothetical protein